jgi:environmental stress-induced protein Ves
MRILRARDRIATPWKNGGGTTAEIAAHPPGAGLDDFDWRISVADVRSGGPFSIFAGIDRKLALLEGALTLTIERQGVVALTPGTPPLDFPGDAKTEAVLTSGDAKDLNVMTRRGVVTSTMTRRKTAGPLAPGPRASVAVAYFLSDATLFDGRQDVTLEPGDALLAAREDQATSTLRSDADFYWIEIFLET